MGLISQLHGHRFSHVILSGFLWITNSFLHFYQIFIFSKKFDPRSNGKIERGAGASQGSGISKQIAESGYAAKARGAVDFHSIANPRDSG